MAIIKQEAHSTQPNHPENEPTTGTPMDWIIFGISAVITIGLLIFMPTWFWVTLPFMLTFFVKAIGYM